MVRLDATATRVADRWEATDTASGESGAATRVLDRRAAALAGVRATADGVRAVTLVGAVVANDDVRRRVRLADRTGGPVMPPRRRGVPEGGWTETGVELVLGPGETRAVGYATHGEPVDRPLSVAVSEPLSDATAVDGEPRRDP